MKPGRILSSLSAFAVVVACGGVLPGCGSDVPLGSQNGTGGSPGTGGTAVMTGSGGAVGTGGSVGKGGSSGGRDVDAAANPDVANGGAVGGTVGLDGPVATGGLVGQTGGQMAASGVAGTIATGGRTGSGGTGQGGAGGAGGSVSPRCGSVTGISCATGTFCDLASQCGLIADAVGVCVPTGPNISCTAEVNPVCGCDGKTYSNDCVRITAGVLKLKAGACTTGTGGGTGTGGMASTGGVPGTGGGPGTGGAGGTVCGGEAGVSCSSGKYCDLDSKCGQVAGATGICKMTGNIACTGDFNPVCGCDGKTYSNDCARNAAGVLKASAGACSNTDGGAVNYSTAWLSWQAPGGAAGTGPAVVVSGGGFANTWTRVAYFAPDTAASNPTETYNLTQAQIDDLFGRVASVNLAALPHETTSWAECQTYFYYRRCTTCASVSLKYIFPSQVTPEMDSVLLWFDQLLGATASSNPRNLCNLR